MVRGQLGNQKLELNPIRNLPVLAAAAKSWPNTCPAFIVLDRLGAGPKHFSNFDRPFERLVENSSFRRAEKLGGNFPSKKK